MKSVQIIVILLSRVFGRKDVSTFPGKWILIIYQIITSGVTLNWGELISSNLDNKLKKVHEEHRFYMSTYLMNMMCAVCAVLEFPSLGWKWKSSFPLIHVHCKILWETRYKEDYEIICNKLFLTLYQVLFGEEAPCLSLEGQSIVKAYGDWYMTPVRVYIRILGSTKPPHSLPHFVPDSLLLQNISYQTFVNGMATSLHRNKKGI